MCRFSCPPNALDLLLKCKPAIADLLLVYDTILARNVPDWLLKPSKSILLNVTCGYIQPIWVRASAFKHRDLCEGVQKCHMSVLELALVLVQWRNNTGVLHWPTYFTDTRVHFVGAGPIFWVKLDRCRCGIGPNRVLPKTVEVGLPSRPPLGAVYFGPSHTSDSIMACTCVALLIMIGVWSVSSFDLKWKQSRGGGYVSLRMTCRTRGIKNRGAV